MPRPVARHNSARELLLSLLIASCCAPGRALGRAPRLPWEPQHWRYARGGEHVPPDEAGRFWDRRLLGHSLGSTNFEQMRRFLEKLNRGEPVTVAAVGSSVVQDHGGAFHSSLERLRAAVASPHPYIYGGADGPPGPAWVQTGWLTYFMRAINQTWPHPDHLLVNAGLGAATPAAIANSMCVELSLPDHTDLVIIENMGVVAPEVTERIAWRLLQHYASAPPPAEPASGGGAGKAPRGRGVPAGGSSAGSAPAPASHPAVILFNTAYAAPAPWDCYYSSLAECCANFTAKVPGDIRAGRGDAAHHEVADYYGFASISHRSVLWAMLRDEYARRMGLGRGECELMARIQRDFIHPTCDLGHVLFADYLVHYLSESEVALFGPAGRLPGHGSGCGACPPPLPRGAPGLLPAAPLRAGGWDVYQMRCYGSSSAANNFLPGRGTDGNYRSRVVALRLVNSSGFEFHEHQTHGDTTRLKPGWVATEAGAFMEVEVDADFAEMDLGGGGGGSSSELYGSGVDFGGGGGGGGLEVFGSVGAAGGDLLLRQRGGGGGGGRGLPHRARSKLRMGFDSPFGAAAGLAHALADRLAGGAVPAFNASGGGAGGGGATAERQQARRRPGAPGAGEALAGGGGRSLGAGGGGGDGGGGRPAEVVEVVVAYLTSYEHMGRARVSCVLGCGCEPQEVDAHHADHVSVSAVAVLPVWPAGGGSSSSSSSSGGGGGGGGGGGDGGPGAAPLARCVIRVEVLRATSSGERKFKVIQVVSRAKLVAGGGGGEGGGGEGEQ